VKTQAAAAAGRRAVGPKQASHLPNPLANQHQHWYQGLVSRGPQQAGVPCQLQRARCRPSLQGLQGLG
jgi:hypothetical protein